MSAVKVAMIQMVSGFDLDANLAKAEQLIATAVSRGARLIVLPEIFALFGTKQQVALGHREFSGDKPVSTFLSQQAARHAVWIVGGSVPIATGLDSERVFAACVVYNDLGEACARYNKLHLFDVDVGDAQGRYCESDVFCAGDPNDVVVVPTPFGRLGLAICYDIRFPELFRHLFALGVDMIAVPAAFTLTTGQAHWLPLLRARAIESQCYILGANQGGQHTEKRFSSGGSVVIGGWGDVLAEAARGEDVLLADIDTSTLDKQRQTMPISQHLRYKVLPK